MTRDGNSNKIFTYWVYLKYSVKVFSWKYYKFTIIKWNIFMWRKSIYLVEFYIRIFYANYQECDKWHFVKFLMEGAWMSVVIMN